MSEILAYNQAIKNTNILRMRSGDNTQLIGVMDSSGKKLFYNLEKFTGPSNIIYSASASGRTLMYYDCFKDNYVWWDSSTHHVYFDTSSTASYANTPTYDYTTTYITSIPSILKCNPFINYSVFGWSNGGATHIYFMNGKRYSNQGNTVNAGAYSSTKISYLGNIPIFKYVFTDNIVALNSFNVTSTITTTPVVSDTNDFVIGYRGFIYFYDFTTKNVYKYDVANNSWSGIIATLTTALDSTGYVSGDGYYYYGGKRWLIGTSTVETTTVSITGLFPIYSLF